MQQTNITSAQAGGPSREELLATIARLEAEKAAKIKPITFKVSEKGAVSVYGLNARFPVTLYLGQWERLIQSMPDLKAFIVANRSKLSVK